MDIPHPSVSGRDTKLHKGKDLNQAILDSVSSQIAVLDRGGIIVAVNDSWKRFALANGLPPERADALTGLGVDYLAVCRSSGRPDEGVRSVRDGILKVLDGRLPRFRSEYDCHSTSRQRWFRMSVMPLSWDKNGGVIISHTDITDSKEQLRDSREQLRALAAHQEQILEQERKRIALEVHDQMGQLLTALNLELSLVGLRFRDNPELLERVEGMHGLVEKTINVVRQVARDLRPASLDLGLVPAIEWLSEDFSRRYSIGCRLDGGNDDLRLDELQSTAIFRVVQESLTNVARHAEAREVRISLHPEGERLRVVVKDDGRGFDTAAVGKGGGFGLFGMRERLLALGGTLRIDSAPGQGTAVCIELPLGGRESS